MLELRAVGEQERRAVLAYSSLDRFLESCGADQPWVLLTVERLTAVAQDGAGGFRFSVMLDVSLPADLRGTAGGMADAEASWDAPDSEDWSWLYLPSRPFRAGQEQAELELQPMPGERLAVMAYTSRRSVEVGCGEQQPWVSVPAGLMSDVRRQAGADTICLDTPLPPYLRHGYQGEVD